MQLVYVGENNLIQLDNVKASATGALVNTAVISGQLKSEDLSTSIGDPITMTNTGQGQYQGTILSSTPLAADTIYFLDLTITGALTGFRRVKCRAVYHQED